jgi:hypothetical protein
MVLCALILKNCGASKAARRVAIQTRFHAFYANVLHDGIIGELLCTRCRLPSFDIVVVQHPRPLNRVLLSLRLPVILFV